MGGASELWQLIGFSLSMLVGCFLAGMVPLSMSLSKRNLKLMSSLGAGLLVGTALAVIIPEGVAILISNPGHKAVPLEEVEGAEHHEHDGSGADQIGLALTSGFVFMLLVDQIGGSHGHSHGAEGGMGAKSMSTTIGLVVHAAADGIAMGAATLTDKADVEFIIFLAIMLHKAPAAFGLTSFLLHEGADRQSVRKVLIIFSLAAPTMALFTYLSLLQLNGGLSGASTGWVMLFSAGTFLYVSTVHVLPEINQQSSNSSVIVGVEDLTVSKGSVKWTNLVTLVLGIFAPVILNMSHHH